MPPSSHRTRPNPAARCRPVGNGFRWRRAIPNERWRGVNTAAPVLQSFLDAELARHNLPPSALALVGFSQGTMMALHVGLRRAVAPLADRRLFRRAGGCRTTSTPRSLRRRDHVAASSAAGPRRPRRRHSGAGAVPVLRWAGRARCADRMAYFGRYRSRHRPGRPAPWRRIRGPPPAGSPAGR